MGRDTFNISLPGSRDSGIIIFALFMYFDVLIDVLHYVFADVDCESSVSQLLTKYKILNRFSTIAYNTLVFTTINLLRC